MSLRDKPIDLLLERCFHFGNDVARQANAGGINRILHVGINELIFDQSSRGWTAWRAGRHVSPVGLTKILIRMYTVLHELCLLARLPFLSPEPFGSPPINDSDTSKVVPVGTCKALSEFGSC
ncbi:hypothetical protein [Bradyrhizobium viridifuturi]|uniref:hypothetical protein n=1 Tax=Bradyrhizobium viridifuturi TaxID=1654716 RepID=UPI000B25A75A|nr:hypothetical protein [Bradyrhizobium viridifuturi]